MSVDGTNPEVVASSATLANEIRNQMLYYKVLRDKHDNSLINTMQDLNSMLKTAESGVAPSEAKSCFVKLEHTKFSE